MQPLRVLTCNTMYKLRAGSPQPASNIGAELITNTLWGWFFIRILV